MKLSIIIATLNRHDCLDTCLQSLANQFQNSSQVEIIVVDQSRESFDFKKFDQGLNLKYVKSEERGASLCRNIGAVYAKGEYYWFLDDDAVLIDFSIEKVLGDFCFVKWIEKITYREYFPNKINMVRLSGTPFYIVSSSLFKAIGGFDEKIGPGKSIVACEDLDLILRISKVKKIKNFNFVGLISHEIDSSSKSNEYEKARGYVLRKNNAFSLFAIEIIYGIYTLFLKQNKRFINVMDGFMSYKK